MLRHTPIAFVAASLSLLACSSSSGGSSGHAGAPVSTAFAAYCTGTLSVDKPLMRGENGAWVGDGSLRASAGTTFLVSPDFMLWGGYVQQSDGSIAKIDADFAKGLVKGADFTSDCATDAALQSPANPYVVIATATLYGKQDDSGAACTIDAGTTLTNYSYESLGSGATVSSAEITSKCGWQTAYAKDFEAAALVVK